MITHGLTRTQSNALYLEAIEAADESALRRLCLEDLFFLLTLACKRKDMDRDWIFERCREVESAPDEYLDLWFREGYKSTIITFGKSIQDVLIDPDNTTIGIFSHTRPIAKGFLGQIKTELEQNTFLKSLFPDVLYADPRNEAPKWSLDGGLRVKRKSNPKEESIEAWGLVDGQPTGKHFSLLVYDDIVTRESVTTPEQIAKTTAALELSYNLGAQGGRRRFIGTRYHLHDPYSTLIERGTVKARVKPATIDGTLDGEPVLLDKQVLMEKRRDMGPYTFSCFPKGAPVLMSDWTEKPIDKIRVGDVIVGYTLPPKTKAKLVRSKVIAINKRKAPIIEATFESGRVVRCTPDHKWYTGRRGPDIGGPDTHLTYVPLGFHKTKTKSLISVYDPRRANAECDQREAGWLSGFFDGEGSVSGKQIHFSQTCDKNLVVCERLESSLGALGFDYGVMEVPKQKGHWSPRRDYYLRGGREEHIRFLRQTRPARAHKLIDMLFSNGTRNFGKTKRDKLVSITELGKQTVYNIQTETGNYICFGYATKNCQMLQNPTADKAMSFKEEWLKYYKLKPDTTGWNIYLIVDPASAKKKTSDYTTMPVIGLAPDNNYYLLDLIRDRLNLTQRADKLFELHRKWKPLKVGYEKYGKDSDIEHIEYTMEQKNYRFGITPLGGSVAKNDRIRGLVPPFEQGRFYLPEKLYKIDYEGRSVDVIEQFVRDEYLSFPVCVHDDMIDAIARILDPVLGAEFPKIEEPSVEIDSGYSGDGHGWMG